MSLILPEPTAPAGLPDPQTLARWARELFGDLPVSQSVVTPVNGAQVPTQFAPPGSPLASPAGLGPSVPGTPLPQGQVPGQNLLPASPQGLNIGHRAPALLPHAEAGNGVPDRFYAEAPAYEPRLVGQYAQGIAPVSTPGMAPSLRPQTPHVTNHFPDVPSRPSFPLSPSSSAARVGGATLPEAHAGVSAVPSYYFVDELTKQPTSVPLPSSRSIEIHNVEAHPAPARVGWDVQAIRRDFPILQERVNGRPLAWLDNAATTHKPQVVIDRLAYFYAHENSNIHRAAHELAARATDAYEGARERVRRFINAPDVNEVIFVRGTTEAINLVAKSWGAQHVGEDDEIIVSHLEHHANIVPWQQLAAAKGARLRVIPVDDSGQVLLDEYAKLLNSRTKIVSVTQVSNALGTVTPVQSIVEMAHKAGAKTLVDGAQSVSHMAVDVQAIDADFFVFSGHKVFGPTGIGALWGKREVLEDMPPWQSGGNMIADVTFERTQFQPLPNTFEAGTGNIADAVGLGVALDYVMGLGLDRIAQYEHELLCYGMEALARVPGLRLIGTARDKASVMSFVLDGYTTQEVGEALNHEGIAVRTGHHCAQPILRRFGLEATVRPSLAFYNTHEEIDRLVAVVRGLAQKNRA